MANLTDAEIFESAIYQLATTDPVLGGPGGIANLQAQQLANRTAWLKAKLDDLGASGDANTFSGNLNDLKTTGFYLCRVAATNKPISDDGMVIVCAITVNPDGGSQPSTLQIFVDNGIGVLYWRIMSNGVVLPWASAVLKSNYDTFLGRLVGMVAPFAMETPPSGWLKCNGQAVSRTTYSALFAAIGTTHGTGNGTTTFNVPDLRGEFIRGFDDGRGVDDSRVFGSSQGDAMVEHVHSYDKPFTTGTAQSGAGQNVVAAIDEDNPTSAALAAGFPFPDPPPTDTETRPRNVALSYFIKY